MSVLNRILLKRAFSKSNGPESSKQERKEEKRKKRKNEHSYVFISPTLEVVSAREKKALPRERYSD